MKNMFDNKAAISYYKIAKERQEYLGVKFFAMSMDSDTVIQICTNTGKELRRGRTNAIGVYTITKLTFASNLLAYGYVQPIAKKEFSNELKNMIAALSKLI